MALAGWGCHGGCEERTSRAWSRGAMSRAEGGVQTTSGDADAYTTAQPEIFGTCFGLLLCSSAVVGGAQFHATRGMSAMRAFFELTSARSACSRRSMKSPRDGMLASVELLYAAFVSVV